MSLPIPPRRRSRSRRRQTSRPIEISKSITRALRWEQHDPSAWREFDAVKEVVSHKLPDVQEQEIWGVITHSTGGSGESYKFDFRRIAGVLECKLAEGHVVKRTLREKPWRCEAAYEANEAVEAANEAGEAVEAADEAGEADEAVEAADQAGEDDEAVEAADQAGEDDEVTEESDDTWVSPTTPSTTPPSMPPTPRTEFQGEPTPPSRPPTRIQQLEGELRLARRRAREARRIARRRACLARREPLAEGSGTSHAEFMEEPTAPSMPAQQRYQREEEMFEWRHGYQGLTDTSHVACRMSPAESKEEPRPPRRPPTQRQLRLATTSPPRLRGVSLPQQPARLHSSNTGMRWS